MICIGVSWIERLLSMRLNLHKCQVTRTRTHLTSVNFNCILKLNWHNIIGCQNYAATLPTSVLASVLMLLFNHPYFRDRPLNPHPLPMATECTLYSFKLHANEWLMPSLKLSFSLLLIFLWMFEIFSPARHWPEYGKPVKLVGWIRIIRSLKCMKYLISE